MKRVFDPSFLLGVSVLSYGLSNALVRYFAEERSGMELSFWLSAATVTTILLSRGHRVATDLKISSLSTAWPFLLLQAAAFLTFVLAMDLAPASLVGAILPIEGIVAVGLAVIFLKEKVGPREIACIAGGAIGAGILASSSGSDEGIVTYGVFIALLSATLYGGAMIVLRRAVKANSSLALTFWACIPVLAVSAPFGLQAIGPDTLTLFAISLVLKPIADLSYTHGVAHAPIALASSTLPMIGMATAGFAWILMNEVPTNQALLAAALISACAIYLVLLSARRQAATNASP
jgi:drug/metabolite transporter (DMT)-like permease